MKTRHHLIAFATGALFGMVPHSLFACPMCMGAQDSPTASAVNNAIYLMFGVLGLIFTGLGSLFFSLYRRSRMNSRSGGEFFAVPGEIKEAIPHA